MRAVEDPGGPGVGAGHEGALELREAEPRGEAGELEPVPRVAVPPGCSPPLARARSLVALCTKSTCSGGWGPPGRGRGGLAVEYLREVLVAAADEPEREPEPPAT